MNGSENGYAGALFFALISLGAILKIEDVAGGCTVGALCAIFAAISLRRALVKAAQAKEEDHQRMEIQFQQLRNKINETSSVNVTAMASVNDAAQLLQENLQTIRGNLVGLNNLTELAKNVESISLTVASLEENSSALNAEIEKLAGALESQKKFSSTEEFKKLLEIEDENKKILQTVLKFLQMIGQILKSPTYIKELEKINSSLEKINTRAAAFDALKSSVDDALKNFSELVKIDSELSKDFSATLDDISAKLETLKNSENPLTEEDINLLKKIVAKIEPK